MFKKLDLCYSSLNITQRIGFLVVLILGHLPSHPFVQLSNKQTKEHTSDNGTAAKKKTRSTLHLGFGCIRRYTWLKNKKHKQKKQKRIRIIIFNDKKK